jgi:predicted NAD/FAD-dependent oxidoreductase
MRVGVVGAGISGLGAARTLAAGGHEVVIFEALPHVGGRIHTVATGGFVFDSGATSISPRGRALEKAMMEEISNEGLHRIERPIFVHNSLRVSAGDPAKNKIERYCYVEGNHVLPERLASGLEIRYMTLVEALEKSAGGYKIAGEEFDAAVLAVPAPEAMPLLESVGNNRPFGNAVYRPCLTLMLGYALPPPDVKYHALLDPDSGHPLVWLSIESLKSPGRAPDGKTALLAQMGPQFSKLYFDADERAIFDTVADIVVRLFGKNWDVAPEVAAIKRWRYSQPEMTAMFENVNRAGQRLLVAGDGVSGGRTEYAYDAGVKAARLLMEA